MSLRAILIFQLMAPVSTGWADPTQHCGPYRLDQERVTVGFSQRDQYVINVLRLYGSENKLAKALSYRDLQVLWPCRDITGDGVPELIVEGHTGGAHCCWLTAIYSLGGEVENILVYEGGATGIDPANIKDLDGTGAAEILALDDSLRCAAGFSCDQWPALPLVLCYRDSRYVDCTAQFARITAGEIPQAEKRLSADLKVGADNVKFSAFHLYALYILAGEKTHGLQELEKMLPAEVMTWLRAQEPTLDSAIRRRANRVHLP